MSDFIELIKDGVNVVGNASSLKGKGLGSEIDSRPTIRFNWIVLNESTGKRTDILATNFPHKNRDNYKWLIADRHHYNWNTYKYPAKLKDDLQKILGKKPSNGCRVLHLLDTLNIPDVHVYGFDWKETPTMIVKDRISTPDNEHHDYAREKEFCLELIEKNNWSLK